MWGQELNYAGGEKVKYEIIDLPIIAIIGKEGLCTKEYLAGVEVYEDTPVPEGWVKWVMPARKYLVTEVQPENYGKIFETVIKSLIPGLGLRLAGAVCDFTEPATGQNKLFFPVE